MRSGHHPPATLLLASILAAGLAAGELIGCGIVNPVEVDAAPPPDASPDATPDVPSSPPPPGQAVRPAAGRIGADRWTMDVELGATFPTRDLAAGAFSLRADAPLDDRQ